MDLYRIDKEMGKVSQFTKLTNEHVVPDRIKKMKVKNCTQVFSTTVATAMNVRAVISSELTPASPSDTAGLLLFFDSLFDSVNGSLINPPPGKSLRGLVTRKSRHLLTWEKDLEVLSKMYFTLPNSRKQFIPPSIKNWIFTIRGFIYIWKKMSGMGCTSLAARPFNQDPVENLFSCIRGYGGRNINPTCTAFVSSLKSLIINNLVSQHSLGSNCEEDQSVGVLDPLRSFVTDDLPSVNVAEVQEVALPVLPQIVTDLPSPPSGSSQDFATAYVSGYILKMLLAKLDCSICKNLMDFSKSVNEITDLIFTALPLYVTCFKLKRKIVDYISEKIDFTPVFCLQHKDAFTKQLLDICINVLVFHYIRRINRILNGKDLRHKDDDILTQKAFQKYSQKVHIRRR
nr:unnamed protein product [Callosobruchus analis]